MIRIYQTSLGRSGLFGCKRGMRRRAGDTIISSKLIGGSSGVAAEAVEEPAPMLLGGVEKRLTRGVVRTGSELEVVIPEENN